jgi:hypothetical protein
MAMPMPAARPNRPDPRPQRQSDPGEPAPTPDPVVRGGGAGSGDDTPRRGSGGGRGDYGDLARLMNSLLGSEPQPSLSSSGPQSTFVAQSIAQSYMAGLYRYDAEPFLASMFWSRLIRSPFYGRLIRRFGASSHASQLVVSHANTTRYDLLLLDSEYRGEPQGELIANADSAIRSVPVDSQMITRVLRKAGSPSGLGTEQISGSVVELATNREFGVAIAQAPQQLSTFSVSPALAIRDGTQQSVATIGVMEIRNSGIVVATTANHAMESQAGRLTVDRKPFTVLGRHPVSDSCLLAISSDSVHNQRRFGAAGPLRGVPPTLYRSAKFDGATSGFISTTVLAFDLSILDPQMDEISRIYTGPDTAPGDSGAALIDSEDRIIGFARGRSRYDASLRFSTWVWAELVCMAHGLFGCAGLATPPGQTKVAREQMGSSLRNI